MYKQPVPFATEATCFLIREAISDEVCQELIAQSEQRGILLTGGDYPPSYRDNDRLVFDDPALASYLWQRLAEHLPAELPDADGSLQLVGLNPRFRVCRYEHGQFFRVHQDGAHSPSPEVCSRLTCQLYLNSSDEFSGGATRFYSARHGEPSGAVRPQRGTAIVFDHRLWHDGEAVEGGRKYVLRTDVLYRRESIRKPCPSSDPSDGKVISLTGHQGYIWSVIPIGSGRLATASRDRTIRLWERKDHRWHCFQVLRGATASLSSLAYVDGQLWSGSRDHMLYRCDLATGEPTPVARCEGAVLGLCSHRDCLLVGSADGKLRVVARSGALLDTMPVSATWLWSIAGLDRESVLTGDEDGALRLCSLSTGQLTTTLNPGHGAVHALQALAADRVAAGFADGVLAIYRRDGDTVTEEHCWPAHHGEVYTLASDGKWLASGGEDGELHLWDLSRAPRRHISFSHPNFVRSACFLDDGSLASACYDGLVRVFAC
jgi:predicted 2-oxoglutarate/Fe(II)-dependent dioxygenase YbiX